MSQKKPYCLSLETKAQIIHLLKKGNSVADLAEQYNVSKTLISKIKNQEDLILHALNSPRSGTGKFKTLRGCKQPELEKELYKWFLNKRSGNPKVSVEMMIEKAKMLHMEYGSKPGEFNARWLRDFKKRFGIPGLTIVGEELLECNDGLEKDPLETLGDGARYTSGDHNYHKEIPAKGYIKKEEPCEYDVPLKLKERLEMGPKTINTSQVGCSVVGFIKTEEDVEKPEKKVTLGSAISAFNTSIQWAEENGFNCNYIQMLREMRQEALTQKNNKH